MMYLRSALDLRLLRDLENQKQQPHVAASLLLSCSNGGGCCDAPTAISASLMSNPG